MDDSHLDLLWNGADQGMGCNNLDGLVMVILECSNLAWLYWILQMGHDIQLTVGWNWNIP